MDVDASDTGDASDGRATDAMPDRVEGDVLDGGEGDGGEAGGPTNYIVNPNFNGYSLAGWTFVSVPADGGPYAFAQAPVGSAITPQGQADELAFYSATDAFTVDVSQTIKNLRDGTYTFVGYFNCGALNQRFIYVKGCDGTNGGPDGGEQTSVIPMPSSSVAWEQVTISGIQVSGGSCTVGFFVDANATQYLNADGFSFERSVPADGGADDAGAD